MRPIDADALKAELNKDIKHAVEDNYEYSNAFRNEAQEWSAEIWAVEDKIDHAPTVEAIPIDYIESEKRRVNAMIEEEAKEGNTKEAERLSSVMNTLDAVISNWRYTTGPDWRGEIGSRWDKRKEE